MKEVAIVTGSGHGLPEKLIKEYDIIIFPFRIHLGNESYRDGVDITAAKMMKIINEKKIVPKSSAPSIAEIISICESIKNKGKSAVFVLMSSKLASATFESIRNAKEKVGGDIEIVDTLQVGPGKELIVLEAAKLAKEGKSKEEVLDHARKVISRTNVIFGISDLMYLYRGGRIGRGKVLMGSMMKVIPLVAIRDMEGAVSPIGRARNIFQANQKMVEVIKTDLEKLKANKVKSFVISHADNKEAALHLKEVIDKNFKYEEMLETEFGCVVMVHPGPKSWAVAYYIE